ncbi:succinate dehydrogenase/fumarate reductase iron-sulfur subunit [Synechocystis sp. LKSZ1]|uniref:succinate dehydrogenase/fumarate reductase iron-sulfur subunit n=1 Tax=Synechocystis sp. LKSZ1 TaxID=3144951 RepID=UPI00336BB990
MQVQFQVLRQTTGDAPRWQTYSLEVEPGATILDCLNRLKWEQDGSLAFRKNCRNTICGSCSIRINGRAALACKESVGQELTNGLVDPSQAVPTITLAPLGNLPVITDLVVNMQPFWEDLNRITPYVQPTASALSEREFLQSPQERDQLNQTGNCILCGACYSDCNGKTANPHFVGPHALAKAQRLLGDSRDSQREHRLADYSQGTEGVWGCTRCYWCNTVCPMAVAPMDQIGQIKQQILQRQTAQASRPVRHRKVLVDLVKAGGWVDERKFGLQVVGNYFRDLRGIASILPLGLRMLSRGKFPLSFEPSTGTSVVRHLIEQVQGATSPPRP